MKQLNTRGTAPISLVGGRALVLKLSGCAKPIRKACTEIQSAYRAAKRALWHLAGGNMEVNPNVEIRASVRDMEVADEIEASAVAPRDWYRVVGGLIPNSKRARLRARRTSGHASHSP